MMLSFYTLWQLATTAQDAGLRLLMAGLIRPLLRLDEALRPYVNQI